MRYWLETLGCPKNQVDSDKLAGRLESEGYQTARSPESADLVVVNTCAFIEAARQESIDTILELSEARAPGARLTVTGCLAERYGPELAAALPEVDRVAGFGVPVTLGRQEPPGGTPSFDLLNLPRPPADAPWAYVKVAEGCDRRCGFCAIPSFRGPQRSRPPDAILAEVDQLGVREVVLVAQDLASYGRDLGRKGLIDLVRDVARRVDRVRLLYLYPSELTEGLTDVIGETGCAYFDLSLQHVSRPHLRRMRRWGDGARFLERIGGIRAGWPEAAFRSSFIVGYPGETEEDHDQLLAFLTEADLDWAGLFPFSSEAGTYAATLDDQVPAALAADRLAEASELQDAITARRRRELTGTRATVLIDEAGVGRSHREAPEIDGVIRIPYGVSAGKWVDVIVTGAEGPDLEADLAGGAGGGLAWPRRLREKFEASALATPANAITVVRLLATPVMLLLIIHLKVSWVAGLAWVAVASTDFLDGWVARRQGATTSGAFLDPLADKVLVIGALVALASVHLCSWLPVMLIAGRELVISAYRSAVGRRGISVPARPLAKLKTACQDAAVGLILLPVTGLHHLWLGHTVLWVAVGLALVSGAQYLMDSRRPVPVVAVTRGTDELPAA